MNSTSEADRQFLLRFAKIIAYNYGECLEEDALYNMYDKAFQIMWRTKYFNADATLEIHKCRSTIAFNTSTLIHLVSLHREDVKKWERLHNTKHITFQQQSVV